MNAPGPKCLAPGEEETPIFKKIGNAGASALMRAI